jgi:DNA-directed RNA polymerase specialized sigma24 family protein
MQVPPGLTEADVLAVVDKLADRMAKRFAFGPYSADDLRQQCFVWTLELLPKFKPGGRLENFLQVALKNKLRNLRRKRLRRAEVPCKVCHEHGHHGDGAKCRSYRIWEEGNDSKLRIMYPLDLDEVDEEREGMLQTDGGFVGVEGTELEALIDDRLPQALRGDYCRMRDGAVVPSERRRVVREAVRKILWESHVEQEEDGAAE